MGFLDILKGVLIGIVGLGLVLYAFDLWIFVHWENWTAKMTAMFFCFVIGITMLLYTRKLAR